MQLIIRFIISRFLLWVCYSCSRSHLYGQQLPRLTLNKDMHGILYMAFICLIMFQVLFLLLMPSFFSIWLGKEHITFDYFTGICFSIYSTIFIWISIQSTLVAGMGRLRVQLICYIVAVVLKITAIVLLYKTFTSWLFVVVATCIALLPYCLIQPICVNRDLKILSRWTN